MPELKTYLSSQELDEFRDLLIERRRRLVESLDGLTRDVREAYPTNNVGGELSDLPTHPADMGSDTFDRDMTMTLRTRQEHELLEVDHALGRIEEGTYGICEGTEEPISKERLRAKPWTRYSINFVRRHPELESK